MKIFRGANLDEQQFANFVEVMSQHSDDELKYIVVCGKEDYQPLAIIAAEEELKRRNVHIGASEFEQITKEKSEWDKQDIREQENAEKERKQSIKKRVKIWLIFVAVGGVLSIIENDTTFLFLFAIVIPLIITRFSGVVEWFRGKKVKTEYRACPCCGYKTLETVGIYEICPVCFWEDDPIQYDDPNHEGGANNVSLKQGQRNFIEFGSCDKELIKHVRKPKKSEQRDVDWKMFE